MRKRIPEVNWGLPRRQERTQTRNPGFQHQKEDLRWPRSKIINMGWPNLNLKMDVQAMRVVTLSLAHKAGLSRSARCDEREPH